MGEAGTAILLGVAEQLAVHQACLRQGPADRIYGLYHGYGRTIELQEGESIDCVVESDRPAHLKLEFFGSACPDSLKSLGYISLRLGTSLVEIDTSLELKEESASVLVRPLGEWIGKSITELSNLQYLDREVDYLLSSQLLGLANYIRFGQHAVDPIEAEREAVARLKDTMQISRLRFHGFGRAVCVPTVDDVSKLKRFATEPDGFSLFGRYTTNEPCHFIPTRVQGPLLTARYPAS